MKSVVLCPCWCGLLDLLADMFITLSLCEMMLVLGRKAQFSIILHAAVYSRSLPKCKCIQQYKSFRLYSKHDNIIKISLLCLDVFFFHLQMDEKSIGSYCDLRLFECVYEWVNEWDHPRSLTISYFFPIEKVESALPSLWKSPTTPSWKIMTKSSNSCWKHSTRGQSSSSQVKKTYGEERSTFWLHPCRSDALMTCHVERSLISE